MTRLLRSPKILIGLALSVAFGIVAIIGPLLAPYNPNTSASTTVGTPMPPSAAHWLGTTQVQQDVLSQLLVGGRSTIKSCDTLFLLHHGRVVAHGTHKDLLANNPLYRHLHYLEFNEVDEG